MLAILISHIIITACCLWSGFLFYRVFSSSQKQVSLIQYAFSGLILLTGITQVAVIFTPADGFYTGSLILLLVLLVLIRKQDFKKFLSLIHEQLTAVPLLSKLFFLLLWLMILIINSGPVMMDDTESYHIQMIKWIQEYGTVPGIANLHERFGFNSSWFSSVAIFTSLPGKMDLFTVLNGVLSVWFCFYVIAALSRLKIENRTAPALSLLAVMVIALVCWPMIRGNAATANYDFIATLIIVVLFTETFFANDPEKKNQPGIEWLVWPVYLFTVRITNYPFLLLSLFSFLYIYKYQKPARVILLIGFCFLLVVPFLFRNFMISGYIFYPSAYFDWFPADWKADPGMMERLVEYIRYYNRVPTTFQDIDVTQSLGATGWIPEWFRYLYPYDKIIVIPGVIGLVAGAVFFFKKKICLCCFTKVFIGNNNYNNHPLVHHGARSQVYIWLFTGRSFLLSIYHFSVYKICMVAAFVSYTVSTYCRKCCFLQCKKNKRLTGIQELACPAITSATAGAGSAA